LLLFLSVIGGYLIGSIPFGYIFVKRKAGVDIRMAGSGNVGGFNAYVVTESPSVGVLVGLLDAAKGILAVGIPAFWGEQFWVLGASLMSATLGHVFPLWLRFKGGRGLATACGGMFLIGFAYIFLWCGLWLAARIRYKSITIANILASIMAGLLVVVLPPQWIESLMVTGGAASDYVALCIIMSCIFLVSHRNCFSEFLERGSHDDKSIR
jgi:glycerol-3-phosphate acyltransferase PlsY